jgi:hypothetical protein
MPLSPGCEFLASEKPVSSTKTSLACLLRYNMRLFDQFRARVARVRFKTGPKVIKAKT